MLTRLILLLALGISVVGAVAAQQKKPDRIKATKTIKAKFVGFEAGDYLHAIVQRADGERVSFFVQKPGLEYFLALKKDDTLDLTYQVVDTFIPEAGARQTIERLIAAKAGPQTYASWWKSMRARFTLAQLDAKYHALVDAATIKPEP
jgi:uncharacterized protein YjiS (DUF1127 family)